MIFLLILKYVFLSLITVINLVLAFRSQKPLKFLLFNAFIGVTTLFILYFTKGYTGLFITINPITVIAPTILGVPSVILIIILNLIILM